MKTYFISDLHLNHKNIIRYCGRPFLDVKEMNNQLVFNWNKLVKGEDVVFFLGDLCFGDPFYWIKKLNGHIVFVKGNHDTHIKAPYQYIFNYKKRKFLLTHNPYYIPKEWKGWVIHGHKHNKAPLIDKQNKKINVSCELTNYKPIELGEILRWIK